MAQPKITVSLNGKVVGSRRTDHPYTHALVLHSFDPAKYRAHCATLDRGDDSRRADHAYFATEAATRYASDPTRARYAAWAKMSVEEYIAADRASVAKRIEIDIARGVADGACVLSYHTRRELAIKAIDGARSSHPAYSVVVVTVDPQP